MPLTSTKFELVTISIEFGALDGWELTMENLRKCWKVYRMSKVWRVHGRILSSVQCTWQRGRKCRWRQSVRVVGHIEDCPKKKDKTTVNLTQMTKAQQRILSILDMQSKIARMVSSDILICGIQYVSCLLSRGSGKKIPG